MKKNLPYPLALASVALLAACGEVKSGAVNTAGNSVEEKTIKNRV